MKDFSTKKNLILLRGLPGAGKSAIAHLLSEKGKHPIFSIDDYFTDSNGDYRFQFDKNHLAYSHCEQRTATAMQEDAEIIFVHNTFVYDWEMEPYFKLSAKHGYTLFVLTVEKHHTKENIHEVSEEQLNKMVEKYKVKLK